MTETQTGGWDIPVVMTIGVPSSIHKLLREEAHRSKITLKALSVGLLQLGLNPDMEFCAPPRHPQKIGELLEQAQQSVLVVGDTMVQIMATKPVLKIIEGKKKEDFGISLFVEPDQTSPKTMDAVRRIVEAKGSSLVRAYTCRERPRYEMIMVESDSSPETKAAFVQLNLDEQGWYPLSFLVRGEHVAFFFKQYYEFTAGSFSRRIDLQSLVGLAVESKPPVS
ncbi:hypothetical protein HYU45_00395 [Candidatus Daviesbacteria bacterium]|nr:hypothetical protein [Candidatus Daviesbacteria bacterium]